MLPPSSFLLLLNKSQTAKPSCSSCSAQATQEVVGAQSSRKEGEGGGRKVFALPPVSTGDVTVPAVARGGCFFGSPKAGRWQGGKHARRKPRRRKRGPARAEARAPGAAEPVAQTSRHLGRWSRSNTLPPREKGRLQHGDSGCNTATGATELPLRSRPRESHRQGERECRLCALQPPAGYEHFPGCSTSRPLPPPPSFLRSLCTPRKRRRRDEEHFEQRSQALRPPSAGFGASPAPPALECPLLGFLGRVKPGGGDFPRLVALIRRWGSSFSPGGKPPASASRPPQKHKAPQSARLLAFPDFYFFFLTEERSAVSKKLQLYKKGIEEGANKGRGAGW